MEWKEKIGMEYGMTQAWNGMEKIVHFPYRLDTCVAYFDIVLLKSGFSFS